MLRISSRRRRRPRRGGRGSRLGCRRIASRLLSVAASVNRWTWVDTSRSAGWSVLVRWGPCSTSGSSSRSLAATLRPIITPATSRNRLRSFMPTPYWVPPGLRVSRRATSAAPRRRSSSTALETNRNPRVGHRGRVLRRWGVDAGGQSMLAGSGDDGIERGEQGGVGEVGERVEPHPQAEVGRPDEQAVKPGRGGDLVEVREAVRRLDHREEEDRRPRRPSSARGLGRRRPGSDRSSGFPPAGSGKRPRTPRPRPESRSSGRSLRARRGRGRASGRRDGSTRRG